jgi:pimeloyl-ACP methyl ester carboxylesterase
VILLHGYPQDWSEWRRVMPDLARDFTVIAMDLRGIGGSAAAASGYDAATMADDVHDVIASLGLADVYIVGHDIGGMVAYAYARQFATQARGVMIVDVPLPGVEPWSALENRARAWHWHFHQRPGLPEILIAGRQVAYFRDIVNRFAFHADRISDSDIADYAAAYGPPESLHASFEMYRAFPANATFNQAHRDPLELPIVLVGADHSGGALLSPMSASLQTLGISRVVVETIPDSGHFIANEQPEALIAVIRKHAAGSPR